MKSTAAAHLDHGLSPAHVAWLEGLFADRTAFFIETVTIPAELAPVSCALYGPAVGDEPVAGERENHDVTYVLRGSRQCASRMVARPARPSRLLTVVAGPSDGEPCVLYTAYGGPAAPREPGDTSIQTWEEVVDARVFWQVHALAADPPLADESDVTMAESSRR